MNAGTPNTSEFRFANLAGIFALMASIMAGVSLLGACSTTNKIDADATVSPVEFADYRSEMQKQLKARRHFQHADHDAELTWNSPQEWRPSSYASGSRPDKGILLVHGLGDSPWSFHDVAQQLSAQGFLVRTVLLPGHGTQPEDMLTVTAEQWYRVVQEQVLALQRDAGQVYLGGFSTGANLVLEYAYAHPEIAGLALFSPGFKSLPFDWLAPLAARLRPWLAPPEGSVPMQNTVRYLNVPTNGFAQFYRTSVAARRLLRERPYDKPVFMVVAQHDSVLDTSYLLDAFQRRFTHPQSRLIWYGTKPDGLADTKRILIREDRLPEQRISQFSHMGLLFSPANPLYGDRGSLRICLNGQSDRVMQACEQGALVWYSDWGYHEDGKVHARLTFNPYFDWQTSVMVAVLDDEKASRASANDAVMASKHVGGT